MKYTLDKENSLMLFKRVKNEKIDIKKTIENAYRDDFEFSYLIEVLSENNKVISKNFEYTSITEDFINFVNEKIEENGVFISLVRVGDFEFDLDEIQDTLIDNYGDFPEKTLGIETGFWRKNLKTKRDISAYELSEFGVKIQKIDGKFVNTMGQIVRASPMIPSFEEFGSTRGVEEILSENYSLNLMAMEWMWDSIVFEYDNGVESTLKLIEDVKNKKLDVKKTLKCLNILDCVYFYNEDGDLDISGHNDIDNEEDCFELIDKNNDYYLNLGSILCNDDGIFLFEIGNNKFKYSINSDFESKSNEFLSYGIDVSDGRIQFVISYPDFDNWDIRYVRSIECYDDLEYAMENPLNQIMIKLIYEILHFS